MQSIIICIFSVILAVVTAQAWYKGRIDNAVYGGSWAPDRRSHLSCVEPNGRCIKSYQCCNGYICMIERNLSFGFGVCKQSLDAIDVFDTEAKLKKKDEECKDSHECADQCCRLIRMGRIGFRQTCGKPGEHACVGRQYSRNEI